MLTLYDYWRSSAAYRVRIGLNLKGVSVDHVAVNLAPGVQEQLLPAFVAVNRQARIPAIATDQGVLNQSLAILEWLEETQAAPALLPSDPWLRAQVRAFAWTLAADVHPLHNVGPVGYLRDQLGADAAQVTAWIVHWIDRGLRVLEAECLGRPATTFAFGDQPGLADICLVPQMYSARRFGVDLSRYPRLSAIDERARAHSAFIAAAPENQKDAPSP